MDMPNKPGFWWIRDKITMELTVTRILPEDIGYEDECVPLLGWDGIAHPDEYDWIAPIEPPVQ